MAEYISRNRLLVVLDKNFGHTSGAAVLKQLIENAPAADVVEVKHGKWEENRYAFCNVCSECGTIVDRSAIKWQSGELNYCPNCGAKMDGGKNG